MSETDLILDTGYSEAFLIAALRENWVKLTDDELSGLSKADWLEDVLRKKRNTRHIPHALELALIYDGVALTGLPRLDTIGDSKLLSEGIVSSASPHSRFPSDVKWDNSYVEAKLNLSDHQLKADLNLLLSSVKLGVQFDIGKVRALIALYLLILVENDITDGSSLFRLSQTFEYLINLTRTGVVDTPASRDTITTSVLSHLREFLDRDKRMTVAVLLTFVEFTRFLRTAVLLDSFSQLGNVPYATSFAPRQDPKIAPSTGTAADDRHGVYELCCIKMSDTVGYAPRVTSIEQLARLRGDKRIKAFRKSLRRWETSLSSGDFDVLPEIEKEVKRRSEELRHLEYWKTVDRWLYWSALPVGMIPIVSTVHTVLSVGVRFGMEWQEDRNWLALGR